MSGFDLREAQQRLAELATPIEKIPGAMHRGMDQDALRHVDFLLRAVEELHRRMHQALLPRVIKEEQREHYTRQAREARGDVA